MNEIIDPSGPDDELSILSDQLSLAHIRIKELEKALKEVEDYCIRGGDLEAMLEIVVQALTGKGEGK